MNAETEEEDAVETSTEIDHEYTSEIVCPHCGYKFGDSWECGMNQDVTFDQECPGCSETFKCSRYVEVTYTTWKKA